MLTDAQLDKLATMSARERVHFTNQAEVRAWGRDWMREQEKQFQKHFGEYGISLTETISKPGFNPRSTRVQLREKYKIAESIVLSQVYALTTGMMASVSIDSYQTVPVVYRQLAKIENSDGSEEEYYPLSQMDTPTPVGDTDALPETSLGGILTRIRNYRFGRILAIARTAFDDDRTGRLRGLAGTVGNTMAYAEERWWLVQLFGTYIAANIRGGSGGNPIVPPMNVAGQSPAGYGGPTTAAGDVTEQNLENVYEAAQYVTGVTGEIIAFDPNSLLAAASRKLTIRKLLESFQNPLTPPSAASTLGGIFMTNVLKGLFEAYTTPFLNVLGNGLDGATPRWGIGEAGHIGLFQNRTALMVETEASNAGKSFDEKTVRTSYERRFGAGVDEPERFAVGN